MRRLVDEGKRQFKLEIAGGFRLTADRLGDRRDFVVIVEHNQGGGCGSRGHRKPACNELVNSLSHFFLVGTSSGFRTSQRCSCCGEQLEYATNKEIRSKTCTSPDCPHTANASAQNRRFFADRDTNAAVNLCLIDEAEAEGKGRPERFQSEVYKRSKHSSCC